MERVMFGGQAWSAYIMRYVILLLIQAFLFRVEGFCTRDRSHYLAPSVIMTSPHYPKWYSVSYCSCVVTMETHGIIQLRLHVQTLNDSVSWCEPEIQVWHDNIMTSICPSKTSNYSLRYELRPDTPVNIVVLNNQKNYIRTSILILAAGDQLIRVGCGVASGGLGLYQDPDETALALQGARIGMITSGVVIVIIVLSVVIAVVIKVRCTRLRKKMSGHDVDITKSHDMTAYCVNNKKSHSKAHNDQESSISKSGHSAKKNDKRPYFSGTYPGPPYDDLDSRSFKGREYYISRGYNVTVSARTGTPNNLNDMDNISTVGTNGLQFVQRTPSFHYFDCHSHTPSLNSNIDSQADIHQGRNTTPHLHRQMLLNPNRLPRQPINLYRVDLPIQCRNREARHSAPSIEILGIKPTTTVVAKSSDSVAPVFSLNDEDICFEDDLCEQQSPKHTS